jgi:2',3'-cyclic-nucleotide 2'-phosphodiesterase (5'-nucleotidase family)
VAGMNLMGYDAMALGPKELSLGLDILQKRMAEAQFPMLSANAVQAGTEQLVAQPYAVLDVGGHHMGIIGLTRLPDLALPGFEVLDPEQAVARYLPEVAKQAETVVLLTNAGYRQAMEFVRAVPGIDLVIAGLPDQLPRQAVRVPETGTIMLAAEQPVAKHTGRRVGKLVVTLGSDGSLSGESWQSVSMDASFADDLDMKVLLDRYRQ